MARKKESENENLEKLLYLQRLEAVDHHLNFMMYTWTNRAEPFTVGFHTQRICAAIDYAIERYRQGISTGWVITVPFRHGKSEILSRKLPAHFLGLFPDSKVILCGHTQALTEGFSKTLPQEEQLSQVACFYSLVLQVPPAVPKNC